MSAAQGKTVPSLKIVGSNPGAGKVFSLRKFPFNVTYVSLTRVVVFYFMCCSNVWQQLARWAR